MALLMRVILLGVTYAVAGGLSMLLTIPPGIVSPVWPSAGIALAAILRFGVRLLPGVFFGSTAINILLAARSGADPWATATVLQAAGIAVGACAQAWFAAAFLRPRLDVVRGIHTTRDVLVLFLFGGVLSCVISALWGPLVLLVAGIVPASVYWLSVFNWWVGDMIGVVLFAPLILLLFGQGVSRGRKLAVAFPVLAFCALTVVLFFAAKTINEQRKQGEFDASSVQIANELQVELNAYLNILTANENFVSASDGLSYPAFQSFTREFFVKYPGIYSLAWLPRVTDAERADFELRMRREGFENYTIYDRIGLNNNQVAARRSVYFPVTYSVPLEENRKALGLDTYGPDGLIGDIRRSTLDQARDSGEPRTTGKALLVQTDEPDGLLVYNPVYRRSASLTGVLDRRQALMGYSAGVFLIRPMLATVAEQARQAGMHVVLTDLSATTADQRRMFDSRQVDGASADFQQPSKWAGRHNKVVFDFAGRQLSLQFLQTAQAAVERQGWQLWSVLIAGLTLSAFFGAFLIVVSADKAEAADNVLGEDPSRARIAAALTGVLVLIVAGLVSNQMRVYQASLANKSLADHGRAIAEALGAQSETIFHALQRFGARMSRSGERDAEWLREDGLQFVRDTHGLDAVVYFDATQKPRWTASSGTAPDEVRALGAWLKTNAEGIKGIVAIPSSQAPTTQGGLLWVLVSVATPRGENGFLGAVVNIDTLVESLISRGFRENYRIQVVDAPKVIYGDLEYQWENRSQRWAHATVQLPGRKWEVLTAKRVAHHEPADFNMPRLLLIIGGLLAVLASSLVYIATIASQRSLLLRRKTLDLLHSEQRMNLILENAGEGIYGVDTNGLTTFANSAAVRLLGYELDEMLNVNQHELLRHATADGELIPREESKIYASFQQGRVFTADDEVFRHKDGRTIPVEYTSAPMCDGSGKIVGAVVVFKDNSARKHAEAALLAANAELEEFSYRTSHDLRSPLVSSTELLNLTRSFLDAGDMDQALQCVDMAQSVLQRLDALVRDIMTLTRVKKMEEPDSEVGIDEVVDVCLQKLANLPGFDRLDVQTQIAPMGTLRMKRTRITLIVENLISNAVKYQDASKPQSWLRITAAKENGALVLAVEDNGLGVPVEQREKLFGMFKRFHSEVAFGTGLGLYMVKKSAEVLGGELRYTPLAEGSRFSFHLPLADG